MVTGVLEITASVTFLRMKVTGPLLIAPAKHAHILKTLIS